MFTLDIKTAVLLGKRCTPSKTKPAKSEVVFEDKKALQEEESEKEFENLVYRARSVIAKFQKRLNGVPTFTTAVSTLKAVEALQDLVRKAYRKKAQVSVFEKIVDKAETVLESFLSKKASSKIFNKPHVTGLLDVAKDTENHWKDEISLFATLDILRYLVLAAAFAENRSAMIEKWSSGDTAWREGIPDRTWDLIQDKYR